MREKIEPALRERLDTLRADLRAHARMTIGEWADLYGRWAVDPDLETVRARPVRYWTSDDKIPEGGRIVAETNAGLVCVETPLPPGTVALGELGTGALLAAVERHADWFVEHTASDIELGVRTYLEPGVRAVLRAEDVETIAQWWPWRVKADPATRPAVADAIDAIRSDRGPAAWESERARTLGAISLTLGGEERPDTDSGAWIAHTHDRLGLGLYVPDEAREAVRRGETSGTFADPEALALAVHAARGIGGGIGRGWIPLHPNAMGILHGVRARVLERVASTPTEAAAFARATLRAMGEAEGTWARVLRHEAAGDFLERARQGGDDTAKHPEAEGRLVQALRVAAGGLADELAEAEDDPKVWDANVAARLERLGKAGTLLAAEVRESTRGWDAWATTDVPARVDALASALWTDSVRPTLERDHKNPPALVYAVHEDAVRVHSRTASIETRDGQRALVFDDADPIVIAPAVDDEAMVALVHRGVERLGTLNSHKMFRWEVIAAHERARAGIEDARVLRVEGGWSTLAGDVLGISKTGVASELRAIGHAQAATYLRLPDKTGGYLIALRERMARGRRPGLVEITVGTMLMPHYGDELAPALPGGPRGRLAREHKRLVPITEHIPPMVGRARDYGPQATLGMLVVREIRRRAPELHEHGGVEITIDRWAELGVAAGVPSSTLPRIIDRWTQDGDDGPAFLERVGPDRYTLGESEKRARDFIAEAGKRSTSGREAGRKGADERARGKYGKRRRKPSRKPKAE